MGIQIVEDVPSNRWKDDCKTARLLGATGCRVIKDNGETVDLEITFPDREKSAERDARVAALKSEISESQQEY